MADVKNERAIFLKGEKVR